MRRVLSYGICYLMWGVSGALGVFDMLVLRNLVQRISVVAGVNPWVFGAIDKFGLFFLGLGWIIFVTASESYYRNGVGAGDLIKWFGRVMAAELAVLVLAYIVPFFIR